MTETATPGHGAAPVVVVSGNPRPGSRTLKTGRTLAEQLVSRIGLDGGDGPASIADVEVSAFAADLFRAPDQRPAELQAALQTVRQAQLLIVATPVYKASYTGLLKAFVDHYQAGELSSVVAIPVVVSGSPAHAFVGELYLRPLLTEIGAVVPTPAFTVTESQLETLDAVVGDWADRFADVLGRQLGVGQREQSGQREQLSVGGA